MKTSSYSAIPRISVTNSASGARSWSGAAFSKLTQWHDRATQRRQLSELDDRLLADIGVNRIDAGHESSKPFWQA